MVYGLDSPSKFTRKTNIKHKFIIAQLITITEE
jgi:hypothetical protein